MKPPAPISSEPQEDDPADRTLVDSSEPYAADESFPSTPLPPMDDEDDTIPGFRIDRAPPSVDGADLGAGGADVGGQQVDVQLPSGPAKPSVYDSQVIIAQVAKDDGVSQKWFEEGRSDRVGEFWKSHQDDLAHEQLIEELDEMKEDQGTGGQTDKKKRKKRKKKD